MRGVGASPGGENPALAGLTRVLENFTPAHIVVDREGNIIHYSSRTGKYLEQQMGSPSRQSLSMARQGLRVELRAALREAVAKRQTIVRERVEFVLDDRVQLIRLSVQPLVEGDREPLYLIVFADLEPPLSREAADLRKLVESTQIAAAFLDRFMVIRSYTPAVTSIFNLIPGDRGRPITDIAHQLEDIDLADDIRRVLDERKPLERSVRLRNSKVFYLMRILPYNTADAHIDGALVTFVNVTDMVVAEEHQRVLVAELNHRVRNMLQVVIGLANQTLHRSEDLKQFEKSFMGRVQALARAYELVSRDGWHKVSIAELLRIQLGPFAPEGSRYAADGETILLTANAALALGLVLYELATNATKYGALSVPAGRIEVSWHLGERDGKQVLFFQWREHDGPKVTQPARHGFGSELVQRQLRYELNGKAAMEFSENGLEVAVEIPAAGAVAATAQS